MVDVLLCYSLAVDRHDGNTEYSTPVAPIVNLYLPHLLPLVQVKLRLGHAMARIASNANKDMSVQIVNSWN